MLKISKNKIGKYFSIIKMGYMRNMLNVYISFNLFNKNLSIFLLKQGFINGFYVTKDLKIKIYLKYYQGLPLIILYNTNKDSYESKVNFKFKKYYKNVKGYAYGVTIYNTTKGLLDINNCLILYKKGQFLINII